MRQWRRRKKALGVFSKYAKRCKSVNSSENNNTNKNFFLILANYTIWDGLSQKTISRYCPSKDNPYKDTFQDRALLRLTPLLQKRKSEKLSKYSTWTVTIVFDFLFFITEQHDAQCCYITVDSAMFLQAFHSQEKQYYADYDKKYYIFY
jgi:hypothetical protein